MPSAKATPTRVLSAGMTPCSSVGWVARCRRTTRFLRTATGCASPSRSSTEHRRRARRAPPPNGARARARRAAARSRGRARSGASRGMSSSQRCAPDRPALHEEERRRRRGRRRRGGMDGGGGARRGAAAEFVRAPRRALGREAARSPRGEGRRGGGEGAAVIRSIGKVPTLARNSPRARPALPSHGDGSPAPRRSTLLSPLEERIESGWLPLKAPAWHHERIWKFFSERSIPRSFPSRSTPNSRQCCRSAVTASDQSRRLRRPQRRRTLDARGASAELHSRLLAGAMTTSRDSSLRPRDSPDRDFPRPKASSS